MATLEGETKQKAALKPVAGGVTAPRGFRAAGVHAGIKRKRKDLAVIVSDGPATAAATFTTNRVQAAPVHVTKEHVAQGPLRAVVCNSGNANAVTGDEGLADAPHGGADGPGHRRRTRAGGRGVHGRHRCPSSHGQSGRRHREGRSGPGQERRRRAGPGR